MSAMRNPKIYLDTSVVSHLAHEDTPEHKRDTLQLWERIKSGAYDVCISEIVINEISRCQPDLRDKLLKYLAEIQYEYIVISREMESFADALIEQKILTRKSYDDCTHIAAAVITNCDIIVSWNFNHMVNVKTINGVRAINLLNGYKLIDIYPPNVLISGGENDE
jgi:predicted nucleic acid-binding protein